VLLYVPPDFIKLEKEAISLLSERVFIAEREAHYLELAETLLCGKNTLDPKPINDDFLFKYGMGAPSQDPKALAITNLNKIMNEIQL
ncbi:MAG: hypothetical protein K2X98_00645, partial [Alphaproteobacteria bacterium]|nr:hypothetical protein [Alphaproteobacteria bacterium]MBX9976745.1 hypothetical protein [Alphaproteobacteria bacterium]